MSDRFDPTRYGIFADSDGLGALSEVETEQTSHGYSMARHCEGCGKKLKCEIMWAELYCLQYGQDPSKIGQIMGRDDVFQTKWVYDPRPDLRCFHPNYHCNCHNRPLVVFNMTPKEAENLLRGAGRNGVIGNQQKQMIRWIAPVVKMLADGKGPAEVAMLYRQAAQRQAAQPPVPYGANMKPRG